MRSWVILLYFLCAAFDIHSQDVESIIKAKPFTFNGGISAGASYLQSSSHQLDQNIGYNLSANVNMTFFGQFTIPLSVVINQNQTSFQKPSFSRTGFSPSWRWITVHAGQRSYPLSQYLSNGMTVRGIGLELSPGPIYCLGFRGTLDQQSSFASEYINLQNEEIRLFDRKVWGAKVGVKTKPIQFGLAVFKGEDDPNTGDIDSLQILGVTPRENLAVAFDSGLRLLRVLSLSANVASSINTFDQNGFEIPIDGNQGEMIIDRASELINVNLTTRIAFAYDASLNIQTKQVRLGVTYQHVDPFFTTMGIAYLQNDIDNYTVNGSYNGAKGKINAQFNTGIQYNNSRNHFGRKQRRWIGNFSTQLLLAKPLRLTAGYNNFNVTSNYNVAEVNDSLAIVSNNRGVNANLTYRKKVLDVSRSISLKVSANQFSVIQNLSSARENENQNITLSYRQSNAAKKINWSASILASAFDDPARQEVRRLGAGLSLSKKWNKFQYSIRPSYKFNFTGNNPDGFIWKFSQNLSYQLFEKSSVSLLSYYVNRNTDSLQAFSQYRISARIINRF